MCNLLDIRYKIKMQVSINDPFVTNLGIAKSLNQNDHPWIIHHTLPSFLCTCISSLYTEFSLSSINSNIVVKENLHTLPRWMHGRKGMLTILPDRLLTRLQHPNTIEYHGNTCVISEDIPHMDIYIFPPLITNSVWTLEYPPSFSTSHINLVLQIVHAAPIQWHAVTSNGQKFTHNYYV